jgi:ankyrin repeat protein
MKSIQFEQAILSNNERYINWMLYNNKIDISSYVNTAITLAISTNSIDVFKIFLKDKRFNVSYNHNEALLISSFNGYIDIVKLLLKDSRIDSSCNINDNIIIGAAINNHNDIVDLLWENKKTQKTLINYHSALYDKLVKKNINRKINSF